MQNREQKLLTVAQEREFRCFALLINTHALKLTLFIFTVADSSCGVMRKVGQSRRNTRELEETELSKSRKLWREKVTKVTDILKPQDHLFMQEKMGLITSYLHFSFYDSEVFSTHRYFLKRRLFSLVLAYFAPLCTVFSYISHQSLLLHEVICAMVNVAGRVLVFTLVSGLFMASHTNTLPLLAYCHM